MQILLGYFIICLTKSDIVSFQDSLVICRLRRNIDFRLNDTPRPSSLNGRTSLIENDSNFSLPQAVEESGIFGGANAAACFSKESSSHNSVEQQSESGSVSDHKQPNELSQPGSSHQVGFLFLSAFYFLPCSFWREL